ncbi:UDP-N-acetylglucosamine 1-carboxyvinyltransferase [Flavipsychrobacter stenotrophus]|uniref:UDP-N-acetylglucosamine 1-carboxyvinyltransferase n=1 Tax=Flavipsychrobacter stenotrophus TaxID=2077091 RepID=A0A2S7SY40_9BACT|nr:UDP-N-acetylglucosamine 1-carboxyvinyltransferase [Flavipsychrobacter stenotrophus]PQJ11850.1 UDP-N-acetylglucosamine 1-carboxyvinyltransferase [Flavipsychrobacter stenotrophus]
MNAFEIRGGNKLSGSITPQGAKNEALQVLCAVLLTDAPVTLKNVPDIIDVNTLIELLEDMGVKVSRPVPNTVVLQADGIDPDYFNTHAFKKKSGKLRGTVMLAGPMLARFKKAYIPQPGGDKIGRRRLDTHILGFEKMGVAFDYDQENQMFSLNGTNLHGARILMEEPSVTGTANLLMAAVLAEGMTTIYNAACEPYVQQLCLMLNSMGAKITGISSNLLIVEGVKTLGGCTHTLLADMIEVGSFIGLAAMTQSELTIKNVNLESLGIIPDVFKRLGIDLSINGDDIYVPAQDHYRITKFIDGSILTVYDHPWPGFTPDLISIMLVVATQAKGTVLIHQKMFESRLFFVDKLIEMGAQIVLCDPHRAVVIGLDKQQSLRGINMVSPDIRAGVALLIAALSATGKSTIQNIHQIDRGYERIDERLNALGADIKRI